MMVCLIGQSVKEIDIKLPFKKDTFEKYYLYVLGQENSDKSKPLGKLKSLFLKNNIKDIDIVELNNALFEEYLNNNDDKLLIRNDFSFIYNTVKKVIDKMDPYCLLEEGCPKDEFNDESWWIANDIFVNEKYEADYIAKLIGETFANSFCEDFVSPEKYVKESALISKKLTDYFQAK